MENGSTARSGLKVRLCASASGRADSTSLHDTGIETKGRSPLALREYTETVVLCSAF